MERSAVEMQGHLATPQIADPVTLDFYEATGIKQTDLDDWFSKLKNEQSLSQVRVIVTLQNAAGRFLMESPIQLTWLNGSDTVYVGTSGLAEFALSSEHLNDLKLVDPGEYCELRQRTVPLGTAYEPFPVLSTSNNIAPIVSDDSVQQNLVRNHLRLRSKESIWKTIDGDAGLRRVAYSVDFSESAGDLSSVKHSADVPLLPEQLYASRINSVVVVGFLKPNGEVSQGTGFVVHPSGLVVTNFHVADKPDALAGGILTADHKFYELQAILAGTAADDLALLKVDSHDLSPIPLSLLDAPIAAEVLAISHPNSNYFSLTHGRITRYFRRVRHAFPSVRMGVTAEFGEGSSGGPLMDHFGNVIGILSATLGDTGQMVHREAIPVSALRTMLAGSKMSLDPLSDDSADNGVDAVQETKAE
jgi:S1-C subfamily serine protease